MKYETPELTALTASNAIQASGGKRAHQHDSLSTINNDVVPGYMDWEE